MLREFKFPPFKMLTIPDRVDLAD